MMDFPILRTFENLEEYSKRPEFKTQCVAIAEDITRKRKTITDLVENLGKHLIDPEAEKRTFGVLVLSHVLLNLSEDFLDANELQYLCTFYKDRLKDHHTVIPGVLKGILALTQQLHLPDGVCNQILTDLFQNTMCQQQQKEDRYNIYQIISNMFRKKQNELQEMGLTFAHGVLSAMDGERDPRNLLFLFTWLPKFLKAVPLGQLTEEMFEVVSCYFPIDYNSPDKKSIQRNHLSESLAPCLCAIEDFGPFCLPLCIEKLDSNLTNAKLDSLNLLILSYDKFKTELFEMHSTEIWKLLRNEIMSKSDTEVQLLSFKALSKLIAKIPQSESSFDLLPTALDFCKLNLRPDQSSFVSVMKIVLAVMSATPQSAQTFSSEIIPLLLNLYNITTDLNQSLQLLQAILHCSEAYIAFHKSLCDGSFSIIPVIYYNLTKDNNAQKRLAGISGIGRLATVLPNDICTSFYSDMNTYFNNIYDYNTEEALKKCYHSLSVSFSQEFLVAIQNIQVINLQAYLNSMTMLVSIKPLEDFALDQIVSAAQSEVAFTYLNKLLRTSSMDLSVLHSRCLRHINSFIKAAVTNNSQDAYYVIKSVVGYQSGDSQLNIIEENLDFAKTSNSIALLNSLLSYLRPDILNRVLERFKFIEELLLENVQNDTCDVDTAVRLIGNIVNKAEDGTILTSYFQKVNTVCSQNVQSNTIHSLIAYTTKALVMRGHSLWRDWITKLKQVVENHENAVVYFRLVISDEYDEFSEQSYCTRRLLYKQMFFTYISTLILTEHTHCNSNLLSAFGCLLEDVSISILSRNFEKIIPLLLQALDKSRNPKVLSSIFKALQSFLDNKEPLMDKYIQELLPRILHLTNFKGSMNVRKLAIQCVRGYTEACALHRLLPFKDDVIVKLGECLDDPKRLVRRDAAEARLLWFVIDGIN